MRLNQIAIVNGEYVVLRFRTFALKVDLPADWGTMTRADKIAWGKAYLADHLSQETYLSAEEIVYPDEDATDAGKLDFENLPGWATWTAAEAGDWIDANVVDLASAKTALRAMAKAIIYLRDVTIER